MARRNGSATPTRGSLDAGGTLRTRFAPNVGDEEFSAPAIDTADLPATGSRTFTTESVSGGQTYRVLAQRDGDVTAITAFLLSRTAVRACRRRSPARDRAVASCASLARSRRRGGSGLGLSIVDAVVAAHGGTVTVESAPSAGTTVRLVLTAAGR